jgi:hypothetical protein
MFSLCDNAKRTESPLVYIIKRFPDHWGRIRQLANDKKFCELCRDYGDAVELHRFWRERLEPQAVERAQDYVTIVAELELEILREIFAHGRPETERLTIPA